MSVVTFRFPTQIHFGEGSLERLPDILKHNGAKLPLVVTDADVAQLPIFEQLKSVLGQQQIPFSVFDSARGNPTKQFVDDGVETYKQSRCDSLIYFGGGCALDVGKAIALMIHHPGDLFDYEDDKPGARPVDQPIPFNIAIPTTAGTGSEVGASTVISTNEGKDKKIIFSPRLTPSVVLADPTLTLTLPTSVTASTGIDALTHNLEAYLSRNYHPMCEAIAIHGLRLIKQSLVEVFENPKHLKGRANMLMASMMGAVAFQRGLGVNHSCAHALSTVYDLHHGLGNATMLRSCMAFNYECAPDLFHELAFALFGQSKGTLVLDWIHKLLRDIELPVLADLGLSYNERLVDVALADACHVNNPVSVQRSDFEAIFKRAFATDAGEKQWKS